MAVVLVDARRKAPQGVVLAQSIKAVIIPRVGWRELRILQRCAACPVGGNGVAHLPYGLEELLPGQSGGNGPVNIAPDQLRMSRLTVPLGIVLSVVLAALPLLADDLMVLIRKPFVDDLRGAPADLVVLQVQADGLGGREIGKKLCNSHRCDFLPILLEDAAQREQGVAAPISASPVLYGRVAEQVNSRLKHVVRRQLPRKAQAEGEALVAAGRLAIVGTHSPADCRVPGNTFLIIADEYSIVIFRRLIYELVIDARLNQRSVNPAVHQIGNHPFRPALHRLWQQKFLLLFLFRLVLPPHSLPVIPLGRQSPAPHSVPTFYQVFTDRKPHVSLAFSPISKPPADSKMRLGMRNRRPLCRPPQYHTNRFCG